MKVLQLNSVYQFGSTGRIVQDLKTVIEKKQSNCAVIYGRGNVVNERNVWKIGSKLNLYIHVAYTRLTDKTGCRSQIDTYKIIKTIKDYDPDIIHLHNIHGYWINIQILFNFLRKYNRPIVWTLHDCWSFTGHCAHYEGVNCQKWQTYCYSCSYIDTYPKSFIDGSKWNFFYKKQLFSEMSNLTLVVPSNWLAKQVDKSFLRDYPCYVIHNGIDLSKFSPKLSCKQKGVFVILGVASVWNNNKGFNDFIQLAKLLDPIKFKIILVGTTKAQKKFLDKQGIIAIERMNSVEQMAKLYSQANVFFNPTYEDNFPTTNLESLACGTPVCTYNTGGSPESLVKECGIVIEKGDILAAVQHFKKWNTYGFNEKSCMEQALKFNKYDRFNQYFELYKSILNNN